MPPGGHVEPNETPIDAVHREVLEETGYSINIIDTYKSNQNAPDINDGTAVEMIRPMKILLETVNYKTGMHKHFDLIYTAIIDTAKDRRPSENEIEWFDKKSVESLDTFKNVKSVTQIAFEAYRKFARSKSNELIGKKPT